MRKSNPNHHNAKKAAVLKNSGSKTKPMVIVLCAAVALTAIAAAFYITAATSSPANTVSKANVDASIVRYPVSMFSDGKARHFELSTGGLTIRYFVLKSSDGLIRAAFDACDVCWPAGKGYFQDGDEMVCRNCGRRFASVLVNEVKGGCNPAPLNRNVIGDQLILRVEDIQQGKPYFDFKGKA